MFVGVFDGEVGEREHSDGFVVVVEDEKASDGSLLHLSCGVEEVFILEAVVEFGRHDLADECFVGIFCGGDGSDDDVAVGDDAYDFVGFADGHCPYVMSAHEFGGLCEGGVGGDELHTCGHDFLYFHNLAFHW